MPARWTQVTARHGQGQPAWAQGPGMAGVDLLLDGKIRAALSPFPSSAACSHQRRADPLLGDGKG